MASLLRRNVAKTGISYKRVTIVNYDASFVLTFIIVKCQSHTPLTDILKNNFSTIKMLNTLGGVALTWWYKARV